MTEKSIRTFFILFLLAVIFFSFATDLPKTQKGSFFSDESTYFSIIQSLAYDHDLEYSRADIVRIREIFWTGPMGVFLKKGADGRLYYAKSFVYPLAAAPFFRLFGTHGILLANGLMIFFVLLMGVLLLRQHHPPGKSFAWTLIYLFASVAFIYIWWITADLFNFFVNFGGLFFFFYDFKKPAWNGLAGIFFALAVFSKPNNILHIGILFLLLLYQKSWKKFLLTTLACLLILGGLLYFSHAQTGSFNYQGGERRSFYGNFPFERSDFTFAGGGVPMSSDNYWDRFFLSPAIVVHNLFYYLFGRFTGMLVYFPSALFLLLFFFFQKKRQEDWFVLAAIGAAILFYILITPDNYFGGGGSLGNRYFFNVFPLFFFLGFRGRDGRFALLPLFAAAVFLAPVFMDPTFHSGSPRFPGISFPVRFFPPEKTQYSTLPSNTNPRAFNKHVGDKYALFFLNDNFHPMEDESFWTYSDQELELFLLAPRQVKTFLVQLKNIPLDNQARLQVEHKVHKVFIAADGTREVIFSHIPGLRFDDSYLYHFKIKSSRSYCPYLTDDGSDDQRWLGVQAHIEPGY